SIAPWVKSVRIVPMRVPRPTLPVFPPASAEIRSANSVRLPLKPTVLTFAMLLPMTERPAPLAASPLRPVDNAPNSAIPSSPSTNLIPVTEPDLRPTHDEHRCVARHVDAVHGVGGRDRERRGRLVALPRHRDLHLVRAVWQDGAVAAAPIPLEGMVAGRLL